MSGREEIVRFHIQHLKQGGNLLKTIHDDGSMFIVYGEGGGCTLHVLGGAAGFWAPIHGTVRVNSTNLSHTVHAKEALITEYETGVKAVGHANSRWLVLLGAKRAWTTLLTDASGHDTQLLPEFHQISRDLRHKAVAVARAVSPWELESAVHAIAGEIALGQAALRAALARCPGRTYAKRRQVFLRLQRVRNFMNARCDEELDNEMLARMANYSPCHFLRTFSSVFLETPHAYLVHQRLLRAKHLLQSGDLAVTEVALASGFESRSAFSRLFRQRFGTTARETMRRGLSGAQH
ncbi:MAG TPA: AraC family transcriptional regulator [Rhodanobacteraceae bacterium]